MDAIERRWRVNRPIHLLVCISAHGWGHLAQTVPRDDWPEAPWLIDWLAQHARCATIALPDLRVGRFEAGLAAIDLQPARVAADGDGAAEIADQIVAVIAERFSRDTPPRR